MVNMIVNINEYRYNVANTICTVDLWKGAVDPTCTMVDNARYGACVYYK